MSYQPIAETSTWQNTTLTTDRHPCPRWDSNPQSQPANDRQSTPYTARTLGWIRDIGQNIFTVFFFFYQEVVASPVTSKFSVLSHSSRRTSLDRYIIIIIIIICINNNYVINNNYGRFQDLILLFKILIGTRENFLETYRQFGLSSSKNFSSPALDWVSVVLLHHTFASPPCCWDRL